MKTTVTISKVYFGAEIETDYGTASIVNINTVEPVLQGKKNDDGEKEIVQIRQLAMRMSDFERILVLDQHLPLLDVPQLTDEQKKLSMREQFELQYKEHIKVLKGAKLTIEREEIKAPKMTQDENGNEVAELDKDGNEVMILAGFGDTKYTSLLITDFATKYCEHLLGF